MVVIKSFLLLIWTYIFQTNLFNFILVVLFFVWAAKKFDFKSKLDAMHNKVIQIIEDAKQNKLNSEKALADAKDAVKNLQNDIDKINADAQQSAETISAKILDDANKQVKNIELNADKLIAAEEKQLVAGLVKEISKISVEKSKENITNMLRDNTELHEKYINESIDKLDGLAL
ncbi:hypothetical protein IJ732_05060 [bacterium]|nr:hypothetical protein [bacterium]